MNLLFWLQGQRTTKTMAADDDSQVLQQWRQLSLVAEKILPAKCKAGSLAYCPTMDLIALVTEDEVLHVFRLNGQRVFGGHLGGDPYTDQDGHLEIRGLTWKNNGISWFSLFFFFLFSFFVCLLQGFLRFGSTEGACVGCS